MNSLRPSTIALIAGAAVALAGAPALAKRKPVAAAAPKAEATEQTARAISEMAGKFRWGMTPDEAMKVVQDEITARYDERLKKEPNAFKQDAIRKQLEEESAKIKTSFVKFDGQKTGWDVSILDREFAHKNDEAMFVIWEKDQRRFLFFYQDKLWKQYIAFNSEHPAFAGKTFDDFADLIQRRYGPAAMTFRKLRTSDDQTLDHLEWPPAGDFVLWAIDQTMFYGNYCLALMQKSVIPIVEKGRKEHGVSRASGAALVDAVTKESATKGDANADIVDQITGRQTGVLETGDAPASPSSKPAKTGSRAQPGDAQKKPASADPLDGTAF